MKQLLHHYKILAFACILFSWMLSSCSASGAGQATENNVLSLLEEKRYLFVPQTANPTGSRTQQVTADFFLKVSPDTIQSYLPYFGRAFTAPITTGKGGMDFTLTNFEYNVIQGRKGRQEIIIRPVESSDIRQMILTVYPNGNATLLALSNTRQQISYNGQVRRHWRR